ncbi:HAD-superfamily hydrolase [Rhodococcoides trifolii]|uniref:HAD-superfamily hydrolase n=1 Tax=Rhodococcoides trifolii TaxID=908250 RepID=A0A917D6U6_9NOCA|nr:HAD-IIA family hydrolase [Rhodococcus trifolii]GGG11153.1 HAD-superfamily hydrolase [Rhodococcus trifolii]
MSVLGDKFDALFLDLDGTLYRGADVVPGAVEVLADCSASLWYVTNNASRSPAQVAHHLDELGFVATEDTVVTSSQAAARVLADLVDPGSTVLVVGTDALAAEIEKVGLVPVRSAEPTPAAVVQGHSPTTAWPILAEATYALRAGAVWVAANTDTTLPSERGFGPGNGAMVAALRAATDLEPIVAGKPAEPLMRDSLERSGSRSPLVVGDRLDTDIEGANAITVPSLLVLTGVSQPLDVLRAVPEQRPTYIASELSALLRAEDDSIVRATDDWSATVKGDTLVVKYNGSEAVSYDTSTAALRAVAPLAWAAGRFSEVAGDGSVASAVVEQWMR